MWHASGTQARMILHGRQTGAAADQRQGKMNGPVQVATDGACLGNPGPGGWAWTTGLTDARGGQQVTTNQEMELRAILEALRAHPDQAIVILTDSQYAIGVVSKGWKAKANQALVASILDKLAKRSRVRFHYVRGHSGHPLNERVDELAREAIATKSTRRIET